MKSPVEGLRVIGIEMSSSHLLQSDLDARAGTAQSQRQTPEPQLCISAMPENNFYN